MKGKRKVKRGRKKKSDEGSGTEGKEGEQREGKKGIGNGWEREGRGKKDGKEKEDEVK